MIVVMVYPRAIFNIMSVATKDEFKIEPRYAHKKKLRQIREKSYGGPKLIDENNFTIKKHKKTENFQISMLYDDPFPRHDFFLWFV